MFYTQSVFSSPRFIPSPYFIPSPQSVVRSPQSVFYADRTHVTDRLVIRYCTLPEKAEAKILNINIIMKMGFVDCVPRTIIFLTRRSVQDLTICTLFPTHRMSKDNVVVKQWVACVARRFCRAGRTSGEAAKFAREELENERRFSSCSRPNLLAVSLPSPTFITL